LKEFIPVQHKLRMLTQGSTDALKPSFVIGLQIHSVITLP